MEDEGVRAKLLALEKQYAGVPKVREPHADAGCWWTLYDYGLDKVKTWKKGYKHPYPGAAGASGSMAEAAGRGRWRPFAAGSRSSWRSGAAVAAA